jgi:hypothetical protein
VTRNPDRTLTDAEFWQLRGHIDAHGYEGSAERLKLPVEVLVLGIHDGLEPENLGKLRDALRRNPVLRRF